MTAKKITSPINQEAYSVGDIIVANDGNKYTVGQSYLESIDPDTYEAKYTYDLVNIDNGEVLAAQTSEQIKALTSVEPESKTGSTVKPNKKQTSVID